MSSIMPRTRSRFLPLIQEKKHQDTVNYNDGFKNNTLTKDTKASKLTPALINSVKVVRRLQALHLAALEQNFPDADQNVTIGALTADVLQTLRDEHGGPSPDELFYLHHGCEQYMYMPNFTSESPHRPNLRTAARHVRAHYDLHESVAAQMWPYGEALDRWADTESVWRTEFAGLKCEEEEDETVLVVDRFWGEKHLEEIVWCLTAWLRVHRNDFGEGPDGRGRERERRKTSARMRTRMRMRN